MDTLMGLWIDHACAHLVLVRGPQITASHVLESGVEGAHRSDGHRRGSSGFVRTGGHQGQRFKRHRLEELRRYYDRVAQSTNGAQRVLVLGPGRAKHEFAARLERFPLIRARLAGVETADKLTDRQIAALVRTRLLPPRRP